MNLIKVFSVTSIHGCLVVVTYIVVVKKEALK